MSLTELKVVITDQNAAIVAEFITKLHGASAIAAKPVEFIEVNDAEEVKAEAVEPKKEPAKRPSRAKKPEPVAEEVEEQDEPETEETNEAEAETKTEAVTVDDIRALQAQKVTAHREAIIAKFKTLDAKGISSLDEKHYAEYYNFLAGLK
jgi:outer membrane biosynthesis protein TonB